MGLGGVKLGRGHQTTRPTTHQNMRVDVVWGLTVVVKTMVALSGVPIRCLLAVLGMKGQVTHFADDTL